MTPTIVGNRQNFFVSLDWCQVVKKIAGVCQVDGLRGTDAFIDILVLVGLEFLDRALASSAHCSRMGAPKRYVSDDQDRVTAVVQEYCSPRCGRLGRRVEAFMGAVVTTNSNSSNIIVLVALQNLCGSFVTL